MINAAKVINLIKHTSSYNDKQYLLKKNSDVQGLKEILHFIYNPYGKTGISTAKLEKSMDFAAVRGEYVMGDEHFVSYTDAIKYFKKHTTGSDADLVMAARFINCTKATYPDYPFAVELAKAIVTQDLQIGVTAKTLNNVYGKTFIPTVGCMLGTKLTSIPESRLRGELRGPYIVTEKLDGIRRILIKENGVCRMFSRSGHEDTGLVEIMEEAKYLPDNRVYDGELLAIGTFADNIALRQASMSRSAIKGTKIGLGFNVFDMLHIDDFYAGKSTDNALIRKIILGATFSDESIQFLTERDWPKALQVYGIAKTLNCIKSVPILGLIDNINQVEPIVAEIWARGGEGVMLNTASGLYEVKRSTSLIKVKKVEEATLIVESAYSGTGKYEDMLGGLVVDYNGNKLGVGSGFTDAQRHDIWFNQDKYIGRKIEIDHFGESTNQLGTKSLNCPIFKRFVGDEE